MLMTAKTQIHWQTFMSVYLAGKKYCPAMAGLAYAHRKDGSLPFRKLRDMLRPFGHGNRVGSSRWRTLIFLLLIWMRQLPML